MAQSRIVGVTGALASGPASSSLFGGDSRDDFLSLDFQATYGASKAGTISINSTDMSPKVFDLEGIVKGRVFALRVLSGTVVKVILTFAGIGDQTYLVDDELILHNENDVNAFSAVKLVGVGDLAYFVSGDVT